MLPEFGEQRPVFNKSVKYLGFIRVGRLAAYTAIGRGRIESFGFFDDVHRPLSLDNALTVKKASRVCACACEPLPLLSCHHDNAASISYRMANCV